MLLNMFGTRPSIMQGCAKIDIKGEYTDVGILYQLIIGK